MSGEDDAKELDLEIAGQKARAKGYRLVDLIWLPLLLGVAYICLQLYNHDAQAQADKAQVAATLSKSNADIAGALKDNSAALAQALKENNANTLQAIRELTAEQRKSTVAIKEGNCLQDPMMRNRSDARDFCKRLTRDDR